MPEALTAETIFSLFKETDRKIQETDRLMRVSIQENDRKLQATRELFQETDRKLKEVSVLVGNLGNRLGEFVENMVAPAAVRMFQERGIHVSQVFLNAKASRGNAGVEVDVLAVNGDALVATECKSKLGIEDVDRHIERLKKIQILFPQWAEYRIYGAVATMVVDDETIRYAEEKGLFVIVPSGDTVEIRNGKEFYPKAYKSENL